MPRNERTTRFFFATSRIQVSSSRSPNGRSGRSGRSSGRAMRIAAGTVSSTSWASEERPRTPSIWATSASLGPRCRRTKESVGARGSAISAISAILAAGAAGAAAALGPGAGAAVTAEAAGAGFAIAGLLATLHVLLIFFGIHQLFQIGGGGEADTDEPPLAMGILVEQLRVLDHGVVDLHPLAGDRGVDLGHRLYPLDGPELVAGVEDLPGLPQLDEDHLAQRLLRELGDVDDTDVTVDLHPLVLPRIEIIGWIHRFHPPGLGSQAVRPIEACSWFLLRGKPSRGSGSAVAFYTIKCSHLGRV